MSKLQRLATAAMTTWKPRYFDIGVNFSDSMFQGRYNGSQTAKHPPDVDQVISRAHTFHVEKMLITASSISESEEHFDIVNKYKPRFGSTVGVHPCTVAQEFYGGLDNEMPLADVDERLQKLKSIAQDGVAKGLVKAFGEIGLDYDRLHYSSKAQQMHMFQAQLDVVASLHHLELPLFLHMRNACEDFVAILTPYIESGAIKRGNGVVHSFTGTKEELEKILGLGFYVGVNGCSLKTQENLEVAKLIPLDRLLIETDAPWCEIRKSHAGYSFLSAYPNTFYPEVYVPKMEQDENADVDKKTKPSKKVQPIKMDELLPFPSIKKENHEKHTALVQQKLETLGQAPTTVIGEFAYPLIKSRNEPVFVGLVAEIMARLYNMDSEEEKQTLVDTVYENSCNLFKL